MPMFAKERCAETRSGAVVVHGMAERYTNYKKKNHNKTPDHT